jgi:hypothetical protein
LEIPAIRSSLDSNRFIDLIECNGGKERQSMDPIVVSVVLGAVVAGFAQALPGFAFGLVAMSFWAWTIEPRRCFSMRPEPQP